MKLRATPGCIAVVHAGVHLPVASDGSIDVEEEAVPVFAGHGFVPWRTTEPPRDPASMTRENLIKHVLDKTAAALQGADTERILSRLNAMDAEDAITGTDKDGPVAVTDDVATMNRPALFALLREKKNIVATLPITNDALRALARKANVG